MKNIYIKGIKLTNTSKKELKNFLFKNLKKNKKFYFVSLNPEIFLEAEKDKFFKKIINNSLCNFLDGIGIVCAFYFKKRFKKNILNFLSFYLFLAKNIKFLSKKRVTGVDFFIDLIKDKRIKNYRIYLIGGKKSIKKQLKKINPELKIIDHNYKIKIKNPKKIPKNLKLDLKKQKPQIVFVCLGHKKQEIFIKTLLKEISSIKFGLGLGGTFDYISRIQKRAPKIFQNLGIEWLWRLLLEPRKRTKRITNALFSFPKSITE